MTSTRARRLSVAEMQAAIEAAWRGEFADTRAVQSDPPRGHAPQAGQPSASAARRRALGGGRGQVGGGHRAAGACPLPGPTVLVLAAHAGAGASTVALLLGDTLAATGTATRLIECADPSRSGIAAATDTELGEDPSGWRRGRRGQLDIDRPSQPLTALDDLPAPRPVDPPVRDDNRWWHPRCGGWWSRPSRPCSRPSGRTAPPPRRGGCSQSPGWSSRSSTRDLPPALACSRPACRSRTHRARHNGAAAARTAPADPSAPGRGAGDRPVFPHRADRAASHRRLASYGDRYPTMAWSAHATAKKTGIAAATPPATATGMLAATAIVRITAHRSGRGRGGSSRRGCGSSVRTLGIGKSPSC
jgi:hypothetical protein